MKQADTAIASYRDLAPTLNERQSTVRGLLREFRDQYGTWPTCLELLRFATTTHVACARFDVNSIRPRLFELNAIGYAAKGPKRICAVSGKRVYTWVITAPAPVSFNNPAIDRARQVELF